jgi:hypothetical protein
MPPERLPEPPGGTFDQAGPSQPRRRGERRTRSRAPDTLVDATFHAIADVGSIPTVSTDSLIAGVPGFRGRERLAELADILHQHVGELRGTSLKPPGRVLLIGAGQEWGLNDRATVHRPREWRRGMVERRLSLGEGGIAALDRRFEAPGRLVRCTCADSRMLRVRAGRSSRLRLHSPARVKNAAGMVVVTVSLLGRERCCG